MTIESDRRQRMHRQLGRLRADQCTDERTDHDDREEPLPALEIEAVR